MRSQGRRSIPALALLLALALPGPALTRKLAPAHTPLVSKGVGPGDHHVYDRRSRSSAGEAAGGGGVGLRRGEWELGGGEVGAAARCPGIANDLLAVVHKELAPWIMAGGRPIGPEHLASTDHTKRSYESRFLFVGGEAYYANGKNLSAFTQFPFVGTMVMMQELVKAHKVPDVEVVMWTADGGVVPMVLRQNFQVPRAVFSYTKTSKNHDILFPHWHHFEHKVGELYRKKNYERVAWADRKPVAFWRGTLFCPGGGERADIYGREKKYKPKQCPRHFFTDLSTRTAAQRGHGEGALLDIMNGDLDFRPIEEHVHYKYLVNLDGAAASSRYQKLLGMGSTVLKMDSRFYQWFEHLLVPFKHYLPFWHTGMEDILDTVTWARNHDGRAKKIAENALGFATKMLTDEGVLCYWALLLEEYSKLIKSPPRLEDWPDAVPVGKMIEMLNKDRCVVWDASSRPMHFGLGCPDGETG